MYFIKVTVPSANLLKVQAEQEKKAKEAAAKKKAAEERKRKLEQELTEKTKQEYAQAVAHVNGGAATPVVDKENGVNQESPSNKKLKTRESLVITVPEARILKHHDVELYKEEIQIRSRISEERQKELEKVKAEIVEKYATLQKEQMAKSHAHFASIKKAIQEATSKKPAAVPSSTAAAKKPVAVTPK